MIFAAIALAFVPVSAAPALTKVWPQTVKASTILADDDESHDPNLLFDDDAKTSWCEGEPGDGTGSTIEIGLDEPDATTLHLDVRPGLQASEKLLSANGAPAVIGVVVTDAKARTLASSKVTVTAGMTATAVDLSIPPLHSRAEAFERGTITVTLRLEQVRKGAKYADTCISDIAVSVDKPRAAAAELAVKGNLFARLAVLRPTAPWAIKGTICLGDGDSALHRHVFRLKATKKWPKAVPFDSGDSVVARVLVGSEVFAEDPPGPDGGRSVVSPGPDGNWNLHADVPADALEHVRDYPESPGACSEH